MLDDNQLRKIVDGQVVAVRRHIYTMRLTTYARNPADDGAILGLQLVGPGASGVERRFELRLGDERLRDEAAVRNAVHEGVRQFVARGEASAP